MLKRLKRLTFGGIMRKLSLSWMVTAAVLYLRLPGELRTLDSLEGLESTPFWLTVLIISGLTAVLAGMSMLWNTERAERWGIAAAFLLLAGAALGASMTVSFAVAVSLVGGAILVYARWGRAGRITLSPGTVAAGLGVGLFFFIAVWTVCRYRSFSSPTYDFGIFSQMFHNMKECGLPLTTLERDGLLSHFAVHFSPVYYLFLPVYCIFPRPETLQVLQALVMALAVIPLWKLCGKVGLRKWVAVCVCGMLVFFPAFSGGAGYDLHENCFLTLFILWTFYGIEAKCRWLTYVFAGLTLLVKEDAAVYVCVIALWLCVSAFTGDGRDRKSRLIDGLCLGAVSLAWFLGITAWLNKYGDGVMTYRYGNFMFGDSDSLWAVVKAVIINPMKALFECVDSEKLKYIGLTLLPLGCIPLFTRKYERYILLIPYILINLMSDYAYQHDLFFQYSFGSTAFLLYLSVVNLADLPGVKKQLLAAGLSLAVGVSCFCGVVVPRAVRYMSLTAENAGHYARLRATLDGVPKWSSVAASTFFTAYLSSREELYDVGHSSKEHLLGCEYIVIDPKDGSRLKKYVSGEEEDALSLFEELMEENGYEKILSYGDSVWVYCRS